LTVIELLQKIKKQQEKSNQKDYLKGIFASQRYHSFLLKKREDENVFFSAAIAYTLQNHLKQFSKTEQRIAEKIIKNTTSSYPHFKNFRDLNTYNFFKTKPMQWFPNGKVMQYFKFFKLADDADDTAYVYLTQAKQDHVWLKEKLIKHANGSQKRSKTTPKNYQHLKAYGVYFGEKMHVEIDVCVLTNILLWHFKHFSKEVQQDIDSITFIQKAINSKDYINTPYLVAPCYPTTAQICYHISRLIKTLPKQKLLDDLKPILITDILNLLTKQQTKLHQILLHISLFNLGEIPKTKIEYNAKELLKNTVYFYTSIPLMIPNIWVRKLQKFKILQLLSLKTSCDAYTLAFLLEYEICTAINK